MAVLLYDLATADDRRLSPFCWRTRMALAHKQIAHETVAVSFTGIRGIGDGSYRRVPVVCDEGYWIDESSAIADRLEATRSNAPSLFGGSAGRALSVFVDAWATRLMMPIGRIVVPDIHKLVAAEDHPYFEQSRRTWLGTNYDAMRAQRGEDLERIRRALAPVRSIVAAQPFIGGETPLYADYQVFGLFQWARTTCDVALIERDDPMHPWLERCLDLYDGLGRSCPAYDW